MNFTQWIYATDYSNKSRKIQFSFSLKFLSDKQKLTNLNLCELVYYFNLKTGLVRKCHFRTGDICPTSQLGSVILLLTAVITIAEEMSQNAFSQFWWFPLFLTFGFILINVLWHSLFHFSRTISIFSWMLIILLK